MDYFAVVSLGTFPTPTPTDSERAAFYCSWGLLDTAAAPITKWTFGGLMRLRLGLQI